MIKKQPKNWVVIKKTQNKWGLYDRLYMHVSHGEPTGLYYESRETWSGYRGRSFKEIKGKAKKTTSLWHSGPSSTKNTMGK